MIPAFEIHTLTIGPITLQVWGLLVGLGILCATALSARLARARGLEPKVVWDTAAWIILGAFMGARAFHVLFYEPTFFFAHPGEILAIWNGGLSISGGFIGASVTGLWQLKRRGVDLLRYADVMAFSLPLGLFVGRIGCFLTRLHPGRPTDFFLGTRFPDGLVRHDLGLYESLNGLALFALFLLLKKKHLPEGAFVVAFLLWYGLTRFLLDFLRAESGAIVDARYAQLTPAQYVALILFVLGVYGFAKIRRHADARPKKAYTQINHS
ncbi:prolipoprotein diacylglyceryl transferase [Candidatus Uhrbacteria bacterium]|nr:prolipoprotein diacylglyceryl transferase [Candidatus Uhrbacteria bacterium]